MLEPVVPLHELLAKSWATSGLLYSLGESACDGFTVDSETGFGGWNERDDFGGFLVVVKEGGGKGIGMYVQLSCPW